MEFKLVEPDTWEEYIELFKDIFGEWDNNQRPNYVVLVKDEGRVVGFASFVRTLTDTLYLQYTGVVKNERGRYYWKVLEDVLEYIKGASNDIRYIVARIENTNNIAIILALKMGWKIIGFRSTTEDVSLVEIIKEI